MYKDFNNLSNAVTDLQAIKNSIKNILLTPKGSLPGKPEFGSDLYKVLFSQMDHLTESMAKRFVKEALRKYEDRITIIGIEIKKVEEFNKLVIDLLFSYTDKEFNNTQDSTSITFNL